jgi:hypothetical protein
VGELDAADFSGDQSGGFDALPTEDASVLPVETTSSGCAMSPSAGLGLDWLLALAGVWLARRKQRA